MTRRRPFEHINPESAVIQEVLSGNRPCRPALWLSSRLWTLMTKMWLEEYKSSPPARPNVSVVLKQLQDEAKYWSLAGGLLAPLQRGAGSGSSIVDLERFDPEGIIRFLQGGSLDSTSSTPVGPLRQVAENPMKNQQVSCQTPLLPQRASAGSCNALTLRNTQTCLIQFGIPYYGHPS